MCHHFPEKIFFSLFSTFFLIMGNVRLQFGSLPIAITKFVNWFGLFLDFNLSSCVLKFEFSFDTYFEKCQKFYTGLCNISNAPDFIGVLRIFTHNWRPFMSKIFYLRQTFTDCVSNHYRHFSVSTCQMRR